MDRPVHRERAIGTGLGRARLALYAAFTLLAVLINAWLGKELAWDTLNYHLYAGFSALHDRFGRDYFAAGPQAYLNPYAYVPFYLLVRSGLPALASASVLAAMQGCVLWVIFELALAAQPQAAQPQAAQPRAAARAGIQLGLAAVALALVNPILLQQIGTSFADITTTLPVLLGWLLLARAVRTPRTGLMLGAGALLGAATALKLTNAVPALASIAIVCFLDEAPAARARHGVLLCAAMAAAFGAVAAPWAWHLQRAFGNPFFPLFNSVFRSPQFSTEPLLHYRFLPANLGEALLRPFAMARSAPLIHEELRAPDARYALLLLIAVLLGARALWRGRRAGLASPGRASPASASPASASPGSASPARIELALAAGLLLGWIVWLESSGNSRYFLPLACVTAVLISTTLYRLCGQRLLWHGALLLAVLAAQASQLASADLRWSADSWSAPRWLDVDIPEAVTREPALYLIMGVQSDAFLAAFLPPHSGFIDVWGEYVFDPDGPDGAQIRKRITEYWPRVRLMLRGDALHGDQDPRGPHLSSINDGLEDYGLRADPAGCARIILHGLHPPARARTPRAAGRGSARESAQPDATVILSCRVLASPRPAAERAARRAQRAAVDPVFQHLESACPGLFQPRGLLTQHLLGPQHEDLWQRLYLNTDLTVWISGGGLRFRDTIRGDPTVELGPAAAWARGPLPLACGRRAGHAFAVLERAPR